MTTLSSYKEAPMSELFDSTGSFFAFSNEQFKKAANPDVTYVHITNLRLFVPKGKQDHVLESIERIHMEAIAKDIEKNGKEAIIIRELWNYECFYVYSPEDAINALKDYGYTEEEVTEVFNRELPNVDL